MSCLCPNGTPANYVGGSIVCSGGAGGGGVRRRVIPRGATDCGNGHYCKDGLKCASGNKCVAKDVIDCGSGKFCAAGNKCARQGGCLPKDSVDCGGFACKAGSVCAANNKCLTEAHAHRLRGGGPIDAKAAHNARGPALLAGDAYTGSGRGASRLGYKRLGNWESVLAKSGKSANEIKEWRKTGFGAVVFTKGSAKSGDLKIVIAFKGPEPRGLSPAATRDWIKKNWPQQFTAAPPEAFTHAADFTKAVQQQFNGASQVSVTGFSLGGTLAAFVGNLLKLETTTLDAPTRSLAPLPAESQAGEVAVPNQTNIITAGDPVSDPLADPDTNLGAAANPLPGATYVVEPTDERAKPTHELKSIIKYVDELAGKEKAEKAETDHRSAFDRCVAGWLRRQGGKFVPEGESTSCMDGNIHCVKSRSDVYAMCRQAH